MFSEHGYPHHTRAGDLLGPVAIAADGTATRFLGPVPDGFCWYVERINCYSNDTNTTGNSFEVFVVRGSTPPAKPDISGRQDIATGSVALNGVSDQESPIYVPPGYSLLGSWAGFTAGKMVSASFQIRWNELEKTGKPTMRNRQHGDAPAIYHPSQLEPGVSSPAEVTT